MCSLCEVEVKVGSWTLELEIEISFVPRFVIETELWGWLIRFEVDFEPGLRPLEQFWAPVTWPC